MSNPVGDDGGREWIEVYNESNSDVDLSTMSVSIKGGSFVQVTPVSGGVTIAAKGYAIIASTVSGATKFMLDYPTYSKPLFKSSVSLVNTGVTSIDIKVAGSVVNSLSSYTAAKEGSTYSLVGGSFVTASPTPGEENKALPVVVEEPTTTPTGSQVTIPQMSSPSADVVLYLPSEKTIVAGAPSLFSVYSLTHAGKSIDNMKYLWSFGDGGERTGASTTYRYFYPGRYIAQVEGSNGLVAGTGRMLVRVVTPEMELSSVKLGKYGPYLDITNPNTYDLDISGWKLSIDGALFSFPNNTLLAQGVTHITGVSMGFASTTVSSSTLIKLLFPNMDEVLRVYQGGMIVPENVSTVFTASKIMPTATPITQQKNLFIPPQQKKSAPSKPLTVSSSSQATTTRMLSQQNKKDTRLASFFKSFFGK